MRACARTLGGYNPSKYMVTRYNDIMLYIQSTSDLPGQSGKRFVHGISDDPVNRISDLAHIVSINLNRGNELTDRFYPRKIG